jgi:8-oxo-dGTP diphosphatase
MPSSSTHETATLAVDLVIVDDQDRVLMIRRGSEPCCGAWALPGGRVDTGETFRDAAVREALEETGLDLTGALLATVDTYGDPARDPRGRVVSIVYATRITGPVTVTAGSDADLVAWLHIDDALNNRWLAFDHERILTDGLERLDDLKGVFEPPGFWDQLFDALMFRRRTSQRGN